MSTMKAEMGTGSRALQSSSASGGNMVQQQNDIGKRSPPEPEQNVWVKYSRFESADKSVTFDSLGIPASHTDSEAEPPESTMQDGGPKRTESSASKMSIKSAVSVFRGGLKKLSNTLKPQDSDPPSDYQRFTRDKSPSKEKADPFAEAVADRVAKGMHGEFNNERQAIAIKLRAEQIGVEKQDQLERKRMERRRKAAEKEKREKTDEAEEQTRREDEEEGARIRKVRNESYRINSEALYQMQLTEQRQAERMDQEGWAGFNEDGTLRPKSSMDPLLEKRLRQAAQVQGKTYTGEDEVEGKFHDASRGSVEATASNSKEWTESQAPSKAEPQRREQPQREVSSAADYFSNKDSSGRHRSPASKTATEAFGRPSPMPRHQIPRKPIAATAAGHRDTNFGDLISEAKGEIPQIPLPMKWKEIGGKGKEKRPNLQATPSLPSRPNESEFFILRDADQKRQRLVKVRKTTYEDPGNPFSPEDGTASEVLLEQSPNEDSKAFMNRSSKWFIAHQEVQEWLSKTQQAPGNITWEAAPTRSAEVPPVPAIPEDFKSEYTPPRAGWTKMKPRLATTTDKIPVGSLAPGYRGNDSYCEKRDSAFYTPFHEIEDMYRDGTSTSDKSTHWRSRI
ncbi:MAG: hypothetical protein Q9165_001530 [Trypethelium subeluteriae]